MRKSSPKLITSGVMAQRLAVPMHRVQRILSTRPDIRPSAYAGKVRLYDSRALAQVQRELEAMDSRRMQASADRKEAARG